ncbi:sulfotransferase family 2 domain-containing protein [Desulfotignum balticum]|uniref:sulfotransferase family 2 domain-containing protein n=1 Tax=Desulfotignum balticum TaxID=115781 RepID=UPI00040037C4
MIDVILNRPGGLIKQLSEKLRLNNNEASQRIIILHNHAFKNAGSTIDWALEKNFNKAFIDHRDDKNMKKGAAYLGPYLIENLNISALSSHHVRLPLPTVQNVKILMIMMFRHPIERVTSVYFFEKKQINAKTLGAKFARTHDLSEYIKWRLRPDVPRAIRNFHLFKLIPLPSNWKKQENSNDLKNAQKVVDDNMMTGFVEKFDESMVLFEEVLRPYFPDIDLSYKIQNVNQRLDDTTEKRIERLENEIGKKGFNSLMEHNRMDLDLYKYAWKQFEKKIQQISDFDAKLDEFKIRCKRYN